MVTGLISAYFYGNISQYISVGEVKVGELELLYEEQNRKYTTMCGTVGCDYKSKTGLEISNLAGKSV